MDITLRVGTATIWQEADVRVEGAAWGADLAQALTSAGLISDSDRRSLRVQRTARPVDADVPLQDLELRHGDLLLHSDLQGAAADEALTLAGAALIVASGHDAGTWHPVPADGLVVGRGGEANFSVDDPGLSRAHFVVRVEEEGVTVADLGSRNGTFHRGRRVSERAELVDAQRPIEAGNAAFRVVRYPDTVDEPRIRCRDGVGEFNRAPRVAEPSSRRAFKVSAPPGDRPARRIPLLASLAPLVLAPAFVLTGGGAAFLLLALLSPVMLLASWYEDRRHGGKDHAEAVERFQLEVAQTATAIRMHVDWESAARWRRAPDPAELLQRTVPSTQLWERRPTDPDFLRLRVGWSDLAAEADLEIAEGGQAALRDAAHEQLAPLLTATTVPVTLTLGEIGCLGLVGVGEAAANTQRWLVFQLAVLHSPREVLLGVVAPLRQPWEWLGRLPHAAWESGSSLAVGSAEARELLARLSRVVEERQESRQTTMGARSRSGPAMVVMVDDQVELPRSLVTTLLEEGPPVGVHLIWSSDARAAIPGQCGAVVTVKDSSVRVTHTASGLKVDDTAVDSISLAGVERASWSLTGLRDASTRDRTAEVPARVSLAEALGLPNPSPELIVERWRSAQGLGAPLGADSSGPHWVDLRDDGPHALLGGTTGAGKSELLQSFVAALAATHPPDRLTFLLVDYKGGAAFKDCVHLPHTVGYVTDLDGHLVSRVLVSLHAELGHRERLLAAVGAKDLVDMERLSPGSAPPSLLLVVDEFAALASELPEFVDGVVNLAQRGRSLGMHLLLATQRPAGAINDNIRANTNLRICLRMNDRSDSEDVIGSPVAAALPRTLPGRAYLRTGATQLHEVQVAYGGGREFGKGDAPASVTVSGHGQPSTTTVRPSAALSSDAESDLQILVGVLEAAFAGTGASPPRAPWLPPLADLLTVGELPTGSATSVILGRRDEPHQQAQLPHSLDISEGGLLVAGAAASGKTTVLRTLVGRLAEQLSLDELQVYALDFGARGLAVLNDLPHCGAVVQGDDGARVVRLLTMLDAELAERRRLLTEAGVSSLDELVQAQRRAGASTTPRILVLLDGYGSFSQAFERVDYGTHVDRLPTAISEGRNLGVHWTITTDRRLAIPASIYTALPQRLVLGFHDSDEYDGFGLDRARTRDIDPAPGRGFSQSSDEVQVAVYGQDGSATSQAAALQLLGQQLAARHPTAARPAPVRLLPTTVAWAELNRAADTGLASVPMGLRDLRFDTATVDLQEGGLLVVGARRSGKSTALRAIVDSLRLGVDDVDLRLLAPRTTPLVDLGGWAAVHEGKAAITEAVDELTLQLGARGPDAAWLVVIVDDAQELVDDLVDDRLADLANRGLPHRVRVVAAADRSAVQRAYGGLLRRLRAERRGVVLQPDPDIDGDLFDAQLDRRLRGGPPGRAVVIADGSGYLTQVAAPELG